MAACIDLTGMKFGRLTVIERAGRTKQGNANAIAETKQL